MDGFINRYWLEGLETFLFALCLKSNVVKKEKSFVVG